MAASKRARALQEAKHRVCVSVETVQHTMWTPGCTAGTARQRQQPPPATARRRHAHSCVSPLPAAAARPPPSSAPSPACPFPRPLQPGDYGRLRTMASIAWTAFAPLAGWVNSRFGIRWVGGRHALCYANLRRAAGQANSRLLLPDRFETRQQRARCIHARALPLPCGGPCQG